MVGISERKKSEGLDDIIVATDDQRIYDFCTRSEINVVMTRDDHPTAIHRIYEVAQSHTADFFIQINGDEPLIDSRIITRVIPDEVLVKENQKCAWGINAISEISNPIELMDPSNIKMVFDESGVCTYMSRSPIPYPYKTLDFTYYKHVGVIGYSMEMLGFYNESQPGHSERIEGIDLLRFIDYGKRLFLINVGMLESISVDTLKDLEEVRKRILIKNGLNRI